MSTDTPPDWLEWPVCRLDDLGEPGAKGFLVGDGDWPFRGFVLRRGGHVYAYANVCPHARHPLDAFPEVFLARDGSLIRCGSHGALFVPESGECIIGPCVGARLLSLDARVDDDGMVRVVAPDSLRDARLAVWPGIG